MTWDAAQLSFDFRFNSGRRRARATGTAQHRRWALTGGLAVGLHSVATSMEPNERSLNDLHFVTERFEEIPEPLGKTSYFAMFVPANNPVAQ